MFRNPPLSRRARGALASLALALLAPEALAQSRPSAPRATLVVLNKADATASLIDPESGRTEALVTIGTGPHEAAAAPDGRFVVCCNYGEQKPGHTLSVIDMQTREVARTIDLGTHLRPHGISFLPDGSHVAVTAEVEGRVLLVDVTSGAITRSVATGARLSHMVVVDADGKRAFTSNIGSGSVSVLDLETDAPARTIVTGKGCEGIALRPGANELWVTNRAADTLSVIDTGTLAVVAEIACGKFPLRIAFTPSGAHAIVACTSSGEVTIVQARERKVMRRISLAPASPASRPSSVTAQQAMAPLGAAAAPAGIVLAADGARAYIADLKNAELVEIETRTWTITRRIATGNAPDGMAWCARADARAPGTGSGIR